MAATAPFIEDYPHVTAITTRWMDNDAYGHVNNVVYYSWFDSVVNAFLVHAGVLDIEHGTVIGLVVETHCNYFRSVAFPETIRAALRVAHLGRSSVRYEVAIFNDKDSAACAAGHFVHVYVDRITRRPSELPDKLRAALQPLLVKP